jgi:hypothetical protein
MPECVFDTSFIAYARGPIANQKVGNLLHKRLTAIRSVTTGRSRVRYNQKLLNEYIDHAKAPRNDVVEQFFELLDSDHAIRVKRSTLSRTDKVKADFVGWPTHDQHVLAAAIGGTDVIIHVTERALGLCTTKVKRVFGFALNHVA